jgi:N-acetyl-alpha-D-muramate 1-phosphate uridylyltransferase
MKSALLLAAGKATRLGALRDRYAKACVPVGGTTPLRQLMEQLAAAGVRRFVVNLHWQASQVRAAAAAAKSVDAELLFLEEPQLLGTGGSLLTCLRQFNLFPDLVVNAKLFTDVNWHAVLGAPVGTLVVHPPSELATFGGLLTEAGAHGLRLAGLWPKSRAQAGEVLTPPHRAAVYTGICRPSRAWLPLLEAEFAQASAEGRPVCLARAGFLAYAAAGNRVPIYEHSGVWCEISTPERVAEASAIVQGLMA